MKRWPFRWHSLLRAGFVVVGLGVFASCSRESTSQSPPRREQSAPNLVHSTRGTHRSAVASAPPVHPPPSASIRPHAVPGPDYPGGESPLTAKKEAYLAHMRSELAEWNEKIAVLKARTEKATSESKQQLRGLIEDLERKRDWAAKQLAQYDDWKSSATLALEDLKQGLERAFGELRQAYEKAKSRW